MSARVANPFSRTTVLALVAFGAIVFIALLYLLGTGEPNRDNNDGGAHAYGKGLTGYAAMVEYLKDRGEDVSIARDPSTFDEENLLVLTPPLGASADEIEQILEDRRYYGPTVLVLPKWIAMRIPPTANLEVDTEEGWVMLINSVSPGWFSEIDAIPAGEVRLDKDGERWSGLGLSASPARKDEVQSIDADQLVTMVRDESGFALAGYLNDGLYQDLAEDAGVAARRGNGVDEDRWPIIVVAEPDLLNNLGFADRDRADLGRSVLISALDGYDMPIVFDVTLNGLGGSQNLLTLAFRPPFLAATLCLILAALVVGWRAFNRFGPALAEERAIAFGKRQLVTNSASLIQRAKRPHLLGDPYARLMRYRLAAALGVRATGEPDEVEAAIDDVLSRRLPDEEPFSRRAQAMRAANTPHDLLRAARALKALERMIHER